MYCQPAAESGWFRVSLNTAKAAQTPAEELRKLVRRTNATHDEQNGNWVWTRERDSEEGGVKIHLYYWFVANIVEPDLLREAIFSYTVLSDRINDAETKKMLHLIGQIVRRAKFHPEVAF